MRKSPAPLMRQYYGADIYQRIGAMGGKKSRGGGFSGNSEAAKAAGKLGWEKRRAAMKNCECGVLLVNKRTIEKHEREGHTV